MELTIDMVFWAYPIIFIQKNYSLIVTSHVYTNGQMLKQDFSLGLKYVLRSTLTNLFSMY